MTNDVAFSVPQLFRRGSLQNDERASVNSALKLLDFVRKHAKVEGARMLDFGCGVKVSQALRELGDPQELYFGFDVFTEMVDYLKETLKDNPKYDYDNVPFYNEMYNKNGEPMTADSTLPIKEASFDTALMFSVITHMVPEDSIATLSVLRRYMKPDGRLVFWAFADPDQEIDFFDENPKRPLLRAKYSSDYMVKIIEQTGWKIIDQRLRKREHTQTDYICTPA